MNVPRLTEGSVLYREAADCYARFAQCEDARGWVSDRLRDEVAGGRVLDLGCGTGKYAALLGPSAQSYIGLDAAGQALTLARQAAAACPQIAFFNAKAEDIPLASRSIDCVLATWVLGTIEELSRRARALAECRRVLRPGGKIFLVENGCGGEFEKLRGRFPDSLRTESYNRWLEQNGLRVIDHTATWFDFESPSEARVIFSAIYGAEAAAQIKSKRIEHRLLLFEERIR